MDELSQWENATRTVKTLLDRYQEETWPAELDAHDGPEAKDDKLWTWFMENVAYEVIDHLAKVCLPTLMWSDATTEVNSDWQTNQKRPGLIIGKGFFVVCLDGELPTVSIVRPLPIRNCLAQAMRLSRMSACTCA